MVGVSRRACICVLLAVGSVFFDIRGAFGQAPNPSACAVDITAAIDDITNAAYDIVQAASDCTLPALDDLACAGDFSDMMSYWFNLGNVVADMTLTCGALDNECAASVMQCLGDASDGSNSLIASASDCVSDPFICTFDVVTAVDHLNGMVAQILIALQVCNKGDLLPSEEGVAWDFTVGTAYVPTSGGGDGGYFERRRLSPELALDSESSNPVRGARPEKLQLALQDLRSLIKEKSAQYRARHGSAPAIDIPAAASEKIAKTEAMREAGATLRVTFSSAATSIAQKIAAFKESTRAKANEPSVASKVTPPETSNDPPYLI